jgi:hypothetical protein
MIESLRLSSSSGSATIRPTKKGYRHLRADTLTLIPQTSAATRSSIPQAHLLSPREDTVRGPHEDASAQHHPDYPPQREPTVTAEIVLCVGLRWEGEIATGVQQFLVRIRWFPVGRLSVGWLYVGWLC